MPTDSSSRRSSATRCSSEDLAVTADELHALVGVDATQRVRVATEEANPGVAREITRILQIDLAVGEEHVDLVGGHVDLGHARPARRDDVLGVILVGGQPHRACLDAQRNVLGHQRDSLALGGEVCCARQNPGVVAVGTEAGGKDRRIAVVELDVQRAANGANGNGLIEPPVLEAKIVEHAERLPGEPAQLVMVPFGFQFTDDHEGDDDFVLCEPGACPGIGQQHGGVEHIGPNGRISHVALLGPCGTARTPSAEYRGTRTGAGPVFVETTDTARIAEHVSHRK
jgi:hypothetical protein